MPKPRRAARSPKGAASSSPSSSALPLRGHVIPNSHLDREWTLEFQQTRRLTVEFLDRMIEIFDRYPQYTFLLDSQTVPLEDYLEIRPENEERLRQLVREDRLSIGPWYSAPDPHTISGESLVRNLLRGDRSARRFGRPMKVGYTPFGFGQVSQLPQIYAGFGIDMVFFYRTISKTVAPEAEFLWEAPDGTVALCSRFGAMPRYNFFMGVWRPVAYGRDAKSRLFQWSDGGAPFKRICASREWDHYFLLQPQKSFHKELLEPSFRKLLETERQHFTTPVIPLMQGMDTTMPDPMEVEIVESLQAFLRPGEEVFFSTLERYAEDLRAHLDPKKLRRLRGEMRHPDPHTPWTTTLESIGSSRPRQKIAHARAEAALQRLAEPFAALAWFLGFATWPKPYLDLAWRHLLLTHPHDTVGGTGIDKLESDALYRLSEVQAISDFTLDDALGALQVHIDTRAARPGDIVVTVFNPSPRPRTEVVDLYLDIPRDSDLVEFVIEDEKGRRADFHYLWRKPGEKTVRDNTDLTMALVCWTTKAALRAEDVPAMGWKTFYVRPAPAPGVNRMERVARSPHFMENEHLAVTVHPDGTLDLTQKSTGHAWTGLHYFLDNGERGNNWESRAVHCDEALSSRGAPCRVSLVENGALAATIRVELDLRIPAGLIATQDNHHTRRGGGETPLRIESFITLRKGARRRDIHTRLDNRARNHRLRAAFPSRLERATHSCAETPYDVVSRVIERGPDHPYTMTPNPTYPMLRFVDVSDGKAGLAIIGKGLHEYEVTDTPDREILLNLLRAYEVTLCTVSYRWERRPDQEGSQVQGPIEFDYAIYPHEGDWERGGVMREAEDFHLPLIPAQTGRTEGEAPATAPLLRLAPESLVLSALKRSEDRDDRLIVRVFNSGSKKTEAVIARCVNIPSPMIMNPIWLTSTNDRMRLSSF